MLAQTIASLLLPVYRDAGWVKDTWFGNDLVTLIIVCPLFFLSIIIKKPLFKLIHTGCLGYIIYNYTFYLLGTEINSVFPIYALLVICGITSLITIFTTDSDSQFAYHYFSETANYILPAMIFIFIGTGLGLVWLGMWFGYIFSNSKLPVSSAEFRLVASLDLVVIVNMMILSGISLIKKKMLGFITGSIIGIQGCLYLLILTVNSVNLSLKQNSPSGELPIWISLLSLCAIGTASLFLIGRKKKDN
jgi:hypothetical protein